MSGDWGQKKARSLKPNYRSRNSHCPDFSTSELEPVSSPVCSVIRIPSFTPPSLETLSCTFFFVVHKAFLSFSNFQLSFLGHLVLLTGNSQLQSSGLWVLFFEWVFLALHEKTRADCLEAKGKLWRGQEGQILASGRESKWHLGGKW